MVLSNTNKIIIMKKSTLLAGVAGFVVFYLLNWGFYGMLRINDGNMSEAMAGMMRGDAEMLHLHLALGQLIMTLVIAHIYGKWARGTHNFMHGLELGAWLGVGFGIGLNLIWYGTSTMMNMTGALIDGVWQVIALGITTGVIALVTGKYE